MNELVRLSEYRDWLRDLKQQIKTGQIKATLSVNSQMIMLYWDMGRQIVEKQEKTKWGSGFIEQLSKDLREEFPEMTGFSKDNLMMMKRFYLFYQAATYQASEIVAQPVQQFQMLDIQSNTKLAQVVPKLDLIPWGHHTMLLRKIKDLNQALFYINKTIENNWSRSVLEYQIESNLYGRQGKAVTKRNYCATPLRHCGLDPQSPIKRRNAA